jgi:fluoride ion exporter CrcB/FEX
VKSAGAPALLNVALTVSAGLAAAQLGFALAHQL